MDDLDLVKLTEIFFVPSSVLVGALSVAEKEPLKAAISFLGLLAAVLWSACNYDAVGQLNAAMPLRGYALAWLPVVISGCWLFSLGFHLCGWRCASAVKSP